VTKVVFEVAALASALANAAKVAPTRGESFEKAAGIVLDITAEECIVMATDTLVRYSTWLTPDSFEGDAQQVSWRLPSRIFADVVGKLRSVRNKTLTLEQPTGQGQIILSHGATKATFMLMDDEKYPRWNPFTPDEMTEVTGLAKAVSMVLPCVAKTGEAPLIGVYLDGQQVIATDRYKFAMSPCQVPLKEPIVIPPAAITSVLKNNDIIQMRVEGSQVYIMPDEYTQISLTAYGVDYPAISTILRRDWPVMSEIPKQGLLDTIDLVSTMTGSDRMPVLICIFGKQQVAIMVANEEVGRIGHVLDTPEAFEMPTRVEKRFNPDHLMPALSGVIGEKLTIGFDPENKILPIYFRGGEGVEFWVSPRQKMATDVA
jgi:DNA polymerase III sliding clamp (beta) subunit (PCNA family)